MSKVSLLEVAGLSVSYGSIAAVNNLNIRLDRGAIVSLIGPNGAGKSSVLNAMLGIVPCSGEVRFNGTSLQSMSVEERTSMGLILVPEKRELFAKMSVLDNLVLGGFRHFSVRRGVDKSRLEIVFALFPRLKERRAQLAETLSGGERQMLALGRALMANPEVLLLDEPSLGLAPLVVREILGAISALRKQGISILLVEQNARAALRISSYGYVLETGTVVMEGPSQSLLSNNLMIETYLGIATTVPARGYSGS